MFRYQPHWQGPLSGRSFERQTEDFLNAMEARVDEIDTRQTPSDAIPMPPGVGSAGTSEEFSRGDHSHPLQTDITGSAGTADRLATPRQISMSGEGSGSAAFDGSTDASIPLSVSCTATGSTERRSIADRFGEVANVKDFGAVGDGVTNDTAAIAAAFDGANGRTVFFPSGTYACTSVVAKTGFDMSQDAVLLYNGGTTNNAFVRIEENGLVFGHIAIDCNNQEIDRALAVYGDDNYFRSIKISNEYSDTILTRGMHVLGNSNYFESVSIYDFVKGAYNNDSTPQGVVMSGSSDGNFFASIYARNGRATVVNASTGTNQFDTVASYDCKDNGFYAVAAGTSLISEIIYDGDDAAFGARHSSKTIIGNCFISKFGGGYALFFGNCERVDIGNIILSCDAGQTGGILGANDHFPSGDGERQGCGKITINSISGFLGLSQPMILRETGAAGNHNIEYFSLGRMDIEQIIDTTNGTGRNLLYIDACSGFDIGEINYIVRINPVDSTKVLYVILPNSRLAKKSYFGRVCIEQLKLDGTKQDDTTKIYDVRLQNFSGNTLVDCYGGTLLYGGSDCSVADAAREGFFAPSAPTAGTWKKSTVVWSSAPAANAVGWSCSAGGNPGTWVAF